MKLINFNLKTLPRKKRGGLSEEHRMKISMARKESNLLRKGQGYDIE